MPILRWFARRPVTSRSPIMMRPKSGCSKPATMRRVVVLPQPLGPRNETNSPCSTERSKSCTTRLPAKLFCRPSMARKVIHSCRSIGARGDAAAAEYLDDPHAAPGNEECDHGQSRRLVGTIGADQLQVGAEGGPI